MPARRPPVFTRNDHWEAPDRGNLFLPGYFADPVVLELSGKHYAYATIEPWGGEPLGGWESADFNHWTYRALNWPTKAACSTASSTNARAWAPSVVRSA